MFNFQEVKFIRVIPKKKLRKKMWWKKSWVWSCNFPSPYCVLFNTFFVFMYILPWIGGKISYFKVLHICWNAVSWNCDLLLWECCSICWDNYVMIFTRLIGNWIKSHKCFLLKHQFRLIRDLTGALEVSTEIEEYFLVIVAQWFFLSISLIKECSSAGSTHWFKSYCKEGKDGRVLKEWNWMLQNLDCWEERMA